MVDHLATSTGQGDSAAGTDFQPQGRIFVVPLAGNDTSAWTYGIVNIRFNGRLSGPGTNLAAATRTRPENPFTPLITHDITNWSDGAKHTYYAYVRNTLPATRTNYFTYYTQPNKPAITYFVHDTAVGEADTTAFEFEELVGYNYVRINQNLPADEGQRYRRWDEEANQFLDYEPEGDFYVRFRPNKPLQVTTQHAEEDYRFYSTESYANKPTYIKDDNNNDVLATKDTDLQRALAELRELVEELRLRTDEQLEHNNELLDTIREDAITTRDAIIADTALYGNQNHEDNEAIVDALGGVLKSGDGVSLDGEITIEGAPPVEGAFETISTIFKI